MKKAITLFIKRPIIITIIIILAFFLPVGLAAPPEGIDLLHAITIGIDKAEEGLEVSVLAFVITPKEKYDESFLLISAKAPTIAEALNLVGLNLGKKLITVHTSVIVISKEFAEHGVIETFNYLFRSNSITNDTFIICTGCCAKEMIKNEQKLITSAGARLEELSLFNEEFMVSSDINIESVYRGYFSPTRSSVISLIELIEEESATQTTTGEEESANPSEENSSNGSNNSNSQSQQNEKHIQNSGKAVILYDGKLKMIMDETEMRGINWLGNNISNISIKAENVTDLNFENALLFFEVEGNEVKKNSYFKNDKPVMEVTIKLYIKLEQVLQENLWKFKEHLSGIKNYLTIEVRNKLENTVKKEFSLGLQKLIENQTDVLDIYKTFNFQNHFKFQKWLNTLEDRNDFLREIDYRVTVRVKATD